MPDPDFAALAASNRLIHDPSRLAILSALLACERADFQYLLAATGLTKGNLSSHLSKLEAGGLIRIRKGYRGKIPSTDAALTAEGRMRVQDHWARLDSLRLKMR